MNSASSAANVTPPLEPRASSPEKRTSIALAATKKSSPPVASNAKRLVIRYPHYARVLPVACQCVNLPLNYNILLQILLFDSVNVLTFCLQQAVPFLIESELGRQIFDWK